MIGAGTIINPIIKIATVVAILGAVYLFIVKPTLDTTEDLTNRASENVPNAAEILDSFDAENVGDIDTGKLLTCIQNASQDVDKVQRCTERFTP